MIAAFGNQMQTNLPKWPSFQGVFLLWYPDLLRWNLVSIFLDYLWVFFVGLWHFGSVFSAIFLGIMMDLNENYAETNSLVKCFHSIFLFISSPSCQPWDSMFVKFGIYVWKDKISLFVLSFLLLHI